VDLLFTIILVISSVLMVLLVLLHKGRGGGLSDMFGGGIGASAAGSTVMERNLDRITVITAIIFTGTTILLAFRLGK
jgi:preprotein translocase subunit SecG